LQVIDSLSMYKVANMQRNVKSYATRWVDSL